MSRSYHKVQLQSIQHAHLPAFPSRYATAPEPYQCLMNKATPLLRIVDQLNTEKLTRIQATVELMTAKLEYAMAFFMKQEVMI